MTYMTEQERPKERMAVFSTKPLQKDNQRLIIQYSSYASDEARAEIPMEAVENKVPIKMPNGDRCYIISDATVGGSEYRLGMAFAGERQPVSPTEIAHIEVVDMVEQGAAWQNIRAYIQSLTEGEEKEKQETENMEPNEEVNEEKDAGGFIFSLPSNDPIPDEAVITNTEMVEATEQSAPIEFVDVNTEVEDATADMLEDWDDSVPVFSIAAEETKVENADNEITIEAPEHKDSAWDGALLTGGRLKDATPWNFNVRMAPVFVRDEETQEYHRVNNAKGEPDLYALLNPTLKSKDRPAGANLGSGGVTGRYGLLSHPTWVEPVMRSSQDHEGIQAKVTAWKEGAKCRVDLDVSQATQLRQDAAARLTEKGYTGFLDSNAFSEAAHSLEGLYKFGFAIMNSCDGRGSFEVVSMALRTYCQNLASAGQMTSIAKTKHTKNLIGGIDFATFGDQIVNAVVELQDWLVNTELMRWIPMEVQLHNRLMVVSETHNLLSFPKVTFKEDGSEDKRTGGYLTRVIEDSYKPNGHKLPYVMVDEQDMGTLYQGLQGYTGAYTHKPVWQSADKKQKMEGNVYGIDALQKRLKTTNEMFATVAHSGLMAANKAIGRPLTLSDKDDVKGFLAEHPEVLMAPVKKGKSTKLMPLAEVPTMDELLVGFTH